MGAKRAFWYMPTNKNVDKGDVYERRYHSAVLSRHVVHCKLYRYLADLPYPVFRPRSRARTIRSANHF